MLKGLGQLGDMAKLMKQAQDMQSKMSDIQKQLEELNVKRVWGRSHKSYCKC